VRGSVGEGFASATPPHAQRMPTERKQRKIRWAIGSFNPWPNDLSRLFIGLRSGRTEKRDRAPHARSSTNRDPPNTHCRGIGLGEPVGPVPDGTEDCRGGAEDARLLPGLGAGFSWCAAVFYVYVLHSLRDAGLYIGLTGDLRRRLKEHHGGESFATSFRSPWKLVYYEAYLERADAEGREKFLKRGSGRRFLAKQLLNYFAQCPRRLRKPPIAPPSAPAA